MRLYIAIYFFTTSILTLAQQTTIPVIKPSPLKQLNLSTEGEAQFYQARKKRIRETAEKMNKGIAVPPEHADEYRMIPEDDDYWLIRSQYYTWTPTIYPDTVYASSFLAPQGANTYIAKNANDLSYKTAWVEGVPGYGVGQSITYHFSGSVFPGNTFIKTITVANGYIKTEKAFIENSRVKKLKLYLNDKLIAILSLADGRGIQTFTFEPYLYQSPKGKEHEDPWALKFEIADIYKGTKYDDTVISEIYFDGPHAH